LIESLSSENEISPAEKLTSTSVHVSNLEGLKKLLKKHKGHFNPSDFLDILKSALLLDKERHTAPDFIRSSKKEPSEADIMKMSVDDDLLAMISAVLDLGMQKDQLFRNLEKRLLSGIGEAEFSLPSAMSFVIAAKRAGYGLSQEIKAALKEVLITQMRDIDSANILIAVLAHWDMADKEVSRAAVVKTAELLGSDMSCCALTVGEMCSLMNKLAERHIRDIRLLPLLAARITEYVYQFVVFVISTRLARMNKYGKKEVEVCNSFLSDVLFKIGSPSSHVSPSCIDQTGTLFDAQIVCEQGSSRLVPISKWGNSLPRPILFFGWGQTRQIASDVPRTEHNALLGWDQLSIRLLRAKGVKPVVVLHSDLSILSSTAEKVQFLRKRILDSASQ
ncbi:hypothetical protein OESDEN_09309, partial [Oesophagostomum dentatum]